MTLDLLRDAPQRIWFITLPNTHSIQILKSDGDKMQLHFTPMFTGKMNMFPYTLHITLIPRAQVSQQTNNPFRNPMELEFPELFRIKHL